MGRTSTVREQDFNRSLLSPAWAMTSLCRERPPWRSESAQNAREGVRVTGPPYPTEALGFGKDIRYKAREIRRD
jgi:hypothetical protein